MLTLLATLAATARRSMGRQHRQTDSMYSHDMSLAQCVLGDGPRNRLEREMRRLDRRGGVELGDLSPGLRQSTGDLPAQALGKTILTLPQLFDRVLDGASASDQRRLREARTD